MDLQSQLFELRDKIKAEESAKGGRAGIPDSAIIEIAKTMPREIGELDAIEGVGKTFRDRYGAVIIKTVNDYLHAQAKLFKANSEVVNTLKELEKKLINLNKSNKLLYIGRTAPKSVIDFSEICDASDVVSLLFKGKRRLKLTDLQVNDKIEYKLNESNYRKLTQLTREVNRDFREKGSYDLYVGYPFIKGIFGREGFEINAPAALFPVRLIKETNYYVLEKDELRDVMYNNSVILACDKLANVRRALPNNIIEELNADSFADNLIEYYRSNGLDAGGELGQPVRFAPETSRPEKRNTFNIVPHVVIGKFSAYSSGIQKDINEIIERLEINDLLKDLLKGVGDIDMYGDDLSPDDSVLTENDRLQERELKYINALNSTQENILIANERNKELVVQGPPGTGKSQVITSLIASAALNNKNVLMVSEKKSALDVVYSRLGNLAVYALMIDDVNDKDAFYRQLKAIFEEAENTRVHEADASVSAEIDKYMYALGVIADKMCDKTRYGIEIYKLYQAYPRWKLDDTEAVKLYKTVADEIQQFKGISYVEYNRLFVMYKNRALNLKLARYIDIIENNPIIKSFRDDASIPEMAAAIDTGKQLRNDYSQAGGGIFKRRKARNQAVKSMRSLLNSLGFNADREIAEGITSGDIDVESAMQLYPEYIDTKQVYDKLIPEAQQYFRAIYRLSKRLNETIERANDLASRYIVNEYLSDFESENRTTLHNINNYNGVLETLSELLEKKVSVTKAELGNTLKAACKFITASKRKGDIKRVIDSKRRWSVKKFTDKFSYELLRGVKIWLLTPEVVSEIMPLINGLFDLTIFDEASQMYIEKAIPSIMRSKSVIIAGDSKQLRPNNLGNARYDIGDEDEEEEFGDDVAALEEESLLDVARFKYPPVMLDFHYRSKYEELIAFSNYAFYDGKLNVAPNPAAPPRPPIEVIDVKDGLWQDRRNKNEAKRIVELIKQILYSRKNRETIGVITFNSAQRDLIFDLIDETAKTDKAFYNLVMSETERKDNGEYTGLFIKNIENVQGDERDIIIFSIGYAKNAQGKFVRQFGWLNQRGGENRLNVAISRAKKKVIVVKSIGAAEFDVGECKNKGPRILAKYLEYAEAVSAGDNEQARRVLLSFASDGAVKGVNTDTTRISRQLKHELERRGYQVYENYGIGNYNIDMAVGKDGVFKLGIEFDSSLYDISRNTRERDYHRWKYFRLRGWSMYRVWSSAWWENPGLELGRILKRLR